MKHEQDISTYILMVFARLYLNERVATLSVLTIPIAYINCTQFKYSF